MVDRRAFATVRSPPSRSSAIPTRGRPSSGSSTASPWGAPSSAVCWSPPGGTTHDDEVAGHPHVGVPSRERARARRAHQGRTPRRPPRSVRSIRDPAVAAQAAPPAAPVAPPRRAGRYRSSSASRLIESSRALGPAFLPVARLRVEWLSLLETRVTVAGFGTQPRVTSPEGTATVGQSSVSRAASGVPSWPRRASGDRRRRRGPSGERRRQGNGPYEGLRGQRWAALFDLGAGFTARLGRQLSARRRASRSARRTLPDGTILGRRSRADRRPALFSSVTLVLPL